MTIINFMTGKFREVSLYSHCCAIKMFEYLDGAMVRHYLHLFNNLGDLLFHVSMMIFEK